MSSSSSSSGGIGFFGLLQVLFIALKLCGVINWKWVFVLLPGVIGIGLFIAVIIFLLVTNNL